MKEYYDIVSNIITDDKFKSLKEDTHHNTNKYDHLIRVSKLSYKIAKHTKANVVETTRAGVLHDFFFGGRKESQANSYLNHPYTSAINAKECFNISDKEADIIKTHMFHHTFFRSIIPFINPDEKVKIKDGKPKSKEAWIVCVSDLIISAYEGLRFNIGGKMALYILFLCNFINIR
ncbi:MAG: HD domain-containing protein [Bacilli bacterium]|nr:HD domain-containing protein [Bacilli bacterium]